MKELKEDDVLFDVADEGVPHVMGEEFPEIGSAGGLTKHPVEVRQLSSRFRLVANRMDVAFTWSM